MDSRDSSAQPPHIHQAHLQHHLAQQPHLLHGVMMIPHSQTQHYPSNNSYVLPNSNNSVASTTSATSNASMMHQQNNRFPFSPIAAAAATATKALDHQFSDGSASGSGGGWLGIEPGKKKRGRPRKYSPDNSIGLGLSPAPGAQVSLESSGAGGTPSSEPVAKRSRGRPPGSGKKQLNALGVTGVGFTPHVIMVNSGEDIVSKVMAFSQQGPRTVCILSATGSVCNVALRQSAMSTGSVSYEGRFEIISLSGSFPSSESDGAQTQTGGLSVSLAGSDGRVMGGGVTGTLKAASPVQIIVGSFATGSKKTKTPPSHLLNFNVPATAASPSSGGSSDSGGEKEYEGGHEPYPNVRQPMQGMPMFPAGYTMKMHPTN